MAFLLAINGPAPGYRHSLMGAEAVLGRHPECDVVVDVGAVSRRHARIVREGGEFFLEDLESRNGTFLNDEDIKSKGRRRLSNGDTVRICEVSFTFVEPQESGGPFGGGETPIRETVDGSGMAVMVDDLVEGAGSTIMSKVDMSSSSGRGSAVLSASPEMKLKALLSITQSLGKAVALDEVLPQVINGLFKIFLQADRGFIVMKLPDGTLAPRWTKLRRDDAEATIRISRTIIRQVMQSQEAILSADAASDSRFDMSQSMADFRIRSMMCAPLIDSDGEAFGALQIDTLDQRHRFTQEDLAVLVSVAAQAGIAIDNAQLHENALRQRALQRDLELAYQVQRGFLPAGRPNVVGYEFFDYYAPANQVGGDYFDYLALPDGRLAVVVADVVGHGVAAALLMAKLSAEIRYCLAAEHNPARALTRLNDAICQLPFEDRFITLVMLVIDPASGDVIVVNAGHMAPLLRRPGGEVLELGSEEVGLPLGITDGIDYELFECRISPGDLLLMYTDGVNESMNQDDDFYTIERLWSRLGETSVNRAAPVGQFVIDDVRAFVGGALQNDDMCLVCVSRE